MRRYADPVDVSRALVAGQEAPSQFIWRDSLWVVRDVVSHWIETGAWWDQPGVAALFGATTSEDDGGSFPRASRAWAGRAATSSVADGSTLATEAAEGAAVASRATPSSRDRGNQTAFGSAGDETATGSTSGAFASADLSGASTSEPSAGTRRPGGRRALTDLAGGADLLGEQEVWRVEAIRGQQASGVFDLCFDWADGSWLLLRVAD